MNTARAAAELDAVEDEVEVVRHGAEGVGVEEVDVCGGFGGGEGVVGGGEAGGAALPGIGGVGGGEEGEVDDPEEVERWVGVDEVCSDGGFMDVAPEPAERCGAAGEFDVPGARLEDYEIALF